MTALTEISKTLSKEVSGLRFEQPVTHCYNPLEYAQAPHRIYLERYGQGSRKVLLLGMNPGPFGMAQTGVPFGDIPSVRDWLQIEASVNKPPIEHPKRPVQGFDYPRREVSGTRLWGWAHDTWDTPKAFFSTFFVWNYCPLIFLEESGKNRTPDKLPANERAPLFEACDKALAHIIKTMKPTYTIGVGAFALKQIQRVVKNYSLDFTQADKILHPSPASPAANRGWAQAVSLQLKEIGIAD